MPRHLCPTALIAVALLGPIAQALAHSAAAGSAGTLTVEYLYEADGKSVKKSHNDLHQWRARRTVTINTTLKALAVSPGPQVGAPDPADTADAQARGAKVERAARDMAPMMASVEKIMEKCGDNEACIARETQKLGFGMSEQDKGKALAAGQQAKEAAGNAPQPRYQAWMPVNQKTSYTIDEETYSEIGDPICLPKPFCKRNVTRKGGGELKPIEMKGAAAAAAGAVEIDQKKKILTVRLPPTQQLLPFAETVKSDSPEIKNGTFNKEHLFRITADEQSMAPQLVVPLSGDGRNQSGEYTVQMKGAGENSGKLTVRWRFAGA